MIGLHNLLDLGENQFQCILLQPQLKHQFRYYADHLKFLNRHSERELAKEKARQALKLKEKNWGPDKEFERVMLQKYVNRFAIQADLNAITHLYLIADILLLLTGIKEEL